MRVLKLLVLTGLVSTSLSTLADFSIQSATQTLGMPLGGNTQLNYLIANNTGRTLTGLSYTPSQSSFANVAINTSCSTLANGASCFFTENLTTQGIGSGALTNPTVCIDGASCIHPETATSVNITSANSAVCWGYNGNGELGNNTTNQSNYPVTVHGVGNTGTLTGVQKILAAQGVSYALSTSGGVTAWGSGAYGGLGQGGGTTPNTTDYNYPVNVLTLTSGVTDITAGDYFSCALLTDRTAKCWGGNGNGQLGNGTSGNNNGTPGYVLRGETPGTANLSNILALSAGGYSTCALLTTDGTLSNVVACWGDNNQGQIGNNTSGSNIATPAYTLTNAASNPHLSNVQSIASGVGFRCALLLDGTVDCWGDNQYGESGNNDGGTSTPNALVATPVNNLTGVQEISAAANSVCALLTNGTVKCWGRNVTSSSANSLTPTLIAGLSNVKAIAVSSDAITSFSACALLNTGILKCWGGNSSGQLGNGSYENSYTPVTVINTSGNIGTTLNNVTSIFASAYYYHYCAVVGGSS